MATLTLDQFKKIAPRCPNPELWISPLLETFEKFSINTPQRSAAFFAQAVHESSEFTSLKENLNYTAKRLTEVWPGRFPTPASAAPYANNPEALANKTYGGRMGNIDPGDGWRYRGRGIFMLTGRENYTAAATGTALSLVSQPELLEQPRGAALSAGWFWSSRGLNSLADFHPGDDEDKDFDRISRIVNGGTVGLKERRDLWKKIRGIIG